MTIEKQLHPNWIKLSDGTLIQRTIYPNSHQEPNNFEKSIAARGILDERRKRTQRRMRRLRHRR